MSVLPFGNPFGPLVGQPLADAQVDLTDINASAFAACQQLVNDVAMDGYSASLTVFGDSGTGKTHLIGRVRKWMETQPQNLFVFVRMETSPAGIWRHLRRYVASSLLRKSSDGIRPLDMLLGQRKNELDLFADRDLSIALEHLLEGRHVRDAAAWLRGEGLPEDVLKSLFLSTPGTDDDLEVISRHIVLSICQLVRPGVVVFCLDQIEAVMSSSSDRDGPHAFAKAVSCLVEETRSAGVICCEQSVFMNTMEQILDNAAKSKVMGRRAAIHPLTWEQAKRLIAARLDTVPELAAERKRHDSGWPLTEKHFQERFPGDAAPARSVIALCKDLFDEWRLGAPPVIVSLDEALKTMMEERFAKQEPADTDAILRNGVPLLARSAGIDLKVSQKPSPLDFTARDGSVAIGICNEVNLTSLASHLKKITQSWTATTGSSVILLRDSRLPIRRSATVTQQRLTDIQANGGRLVTVSQEALEALAALRHLLSDAESGDLAHNYQSVTPKQVEQWIAGHLPAALDQLVSEFGDSAANPAKLTHAIADLLAQRKMVRLEDAARDLAVTIAEVDEAVRRDPHQFGLLGGSVPILFQPVTPSKATPTT
jgi:hypothetical protein